MEEAAEKAFNEIFGKAKPGLCMGDRGDYGSLWNMGETGETMGVYGRQGRLWESMEHGGDRGDYGSLWEHGGDRGDYGILWNMGETGETMGVYGNMGETGGKICLYSVLVLYFMITKTTHVCMCMIQCTEM